MHSHLTEAGASKDTNSCEGVQKDLFTCSKTETRRPTVDENRLGQLLVERVLPPFEKSIKIQALVVYQADKEKMNCLLVDRTYNKPSETEGSWNKEESGHNGVHQTSVLSDSGFIDQSQCNLSVGTPTKSDDDVACADLSESFQLGSRRKRKLCKPCRIPQDGQPELAGNQVECLSPNEKPLISDPHDLSLIPSNTECKTTGLPGVQPMNPITLQERVVLPMSAVTLLPRLSLFSLPLTVLSTLPRPILPRSELERLNPTVVSSPALIPSYTTSSPSKQPILSTVTNNMSVTAIDPLLSDNSRRLGKSFVCNQCRRDFSSLNALCSHTFSVHRGFRCTICRAQFTQRSNLQRHSLRHVGFKPFVCKICEKSYYRKDHLVRHIEISHPGCDPRASLTVKLTSAECLDYLDQLQQNNVEKEQARLLYKSEDDSELKNITTSDESVVINAVAIATPEPTSVSGS